MFSTAKPFSIEERSVVFQVSFIIFVRMAALFFPLPIFSPLANELVSATPFLVGLSIGIYALMQAVLQIPLGYLSDRLGRKKIIITGLIIFLIGSVLCGLATDIHQLILARFIQGLGAVSSTLSALIADQTRENQRAKAMAIIGGSVGLAFFVCTITSPLIADFFGLSQVFWLISLLALIALLVSFFLPQSNHQAFSKGLSKSLKLKNILSLKLVYLDASIFLAHFILSANFFVLPIILIQNFGVNLLEHWKIYSFVLVFSIPAMLLTIYLVDKVQKVSKAFLFSLILLVISHLLFIFHSSLTVFIIAMLLFFNGFTSLETILPAVATKQTTSDNKGLVMGFFNSSQQLGSALGAMVAGLIGFINQEFIFSLNLIMLLIWSLINLKICSQFNFSSRTIKG